MKKDSSEYDYVICGGGCAGLSLGMRLADPLFADKNVLIIDREQKTENDKTWCFWEEHDADEHYEDIISNVWNNIIISDQTRRLKKSLSPLQYKRVQSIHFYEKAMSLINSAPHIQMVCENILEIKDHKNKVEVITQGATYRGKLCFSSIPRTERDSKEYMLKQAFFRMDYTICIFCL